MDKNKNPVDQIITEDLLSLADEIDKEIDAANMPKMPADVKARIKARLDQQIADYEKEREKERLFEQLSEEDKKALELGRKMLEEEDGKESNDGKTAEVVVYRRKSRRTWVAVAAVAILVLATGMTSMGGPKRVIERIKVMIGSREIVRVETDEDNYIHTSEDEEKAYQEIKDVFGVDAVRPTHWPEGTIFKIAEIDEKLLTATLVYDFKGENISYYISSHFTDSSLGVDAEDKIITTYFLNVGGYEIKIREYETPDTRTKMYSAKYAYNGLEYFIMGTMEQNDFEYLIKNLNFF